MSSTGFMQIVCSMCGHAAHSSLECARGATGPCFCPHNETLRPGTRQTQSRQEFVSDLRPVLERIAAALERLVDLAAAEEAQR